MTSAPSARRRIRPPAARQTMASDLSSGLFELHLDATALRWPSPRYRDEPVGFFRDILGVDPWSEQQRVLESIRDNPSTAWKSGRRVAKSNTCGGSALWFHASHDDARVFMTAPTVRQVQDILWRQTRMMFFRAGKCVACKLEDPQDALIMRPCPHSALLDGTMAERATTGLVSADFREIKGFTASEIESAQGFAGANLYFIFDESSGIDDALYDALEGNRAGWSKTGSGRVRALYTGNPTRTSGKFYKIFTSETEYHHCITTSSEDTPNYREQREVIQGLASFDWVEEKKRMWGEQSALYLVHVKGEFAVKEDGKIFSVHAIGQAEERWKGQAAELELGNDNAIALPQFGGRRLWIGLDPSGESGTGDEAVFCPRRGARALELVAFLGLSPEAHVVHLLSMIAKHKEPRERPVVVLDREGAVGSKVYNALAPIYDDGRGPFELVTVRASDGAHRQPHIYDRMRDELVANLEGWIGEGGAIPEDVKLAAEMHKFEWEQQARGGRLKVTPKKVIKKQLGRSPDRFDALSLSCWVPLELQVDVPESATKKSGRGRDDDDDTADINDPYAHRGAMNPYGHRR